MTTDSPDTLRSLLAEYDLARAYSEALVAHLDPDQVAWRPNENSSAIGWHLGHQAAVNHFIVRNLTAAEPSFNTAYDAVFDSATLEPARGSLPPVDEILAYRSAIASSTATIIGRIANGDVGAPEQLTVIAHGLLRAVINHEYQHDAWVLEVRDTMVETPAPVPESAQVIAVEGYWMTTA
jgi:hypothetical protein